MQMPRLEEQSADKVPRQSGTRIDKSIQPLTVLEENDKKTKEDKVMPANTPAAPIIADPESKKEMEKVSPSSAAADKAIILNEANSNKAMRSAKQRPGINEKMPGIYYFTGQVKDNQDNPVPFANIAIRNTQRTTYTDANGNFRVVAGDSTLEVDIKSVGYLMRSIQLSNNQPYQDVVLQPVRKAKAKSITIPLEPEESDSVEAKESAEDMEKPDAEPRDGFAAYQFYLLNNVRIPADAKNSSIKGSVDVSFLVNDNSRLSDFK
ncbi:MAG: carboxypeptidase-like regulatory domain-containing protein, partial [Chitinophagaceae bacterium]